MGYMKIALLGYGVEGASAHRYFSERYPTAEFVIYDNAPSPKYEIPKGVELHAGVDSFLNIDADIVVKTPAINPESVTTRGKVTSVTQEFFDVCPVSIIGVTGTKGKGTTASLIASVLKKAGISTWLVGNIGIAALDVINDIREKQSAGKKCVVVYELSSFQLWDMKKSPHVAVVLMIEPEHLNVHKDFDDYVAAKQHIVTYQHKDDAVIYYEENDVSAAIAEQSPGRKIPYKVSQGPTLKIHDEVIALRSDIQLYGEHNVGNVLAAMLAAWQFTQDTQAIKQAIREFHGLPHRLEPVVTVNDILFINDSFSSAPPASLAAVRAFSQPEILIMGGFDRGLDFSEVACDISMQQNLKKVLLIGQTRERIAESFEACGWDKYEVIDRGLETAVMRANQLAEAGDVVILSPGCASFDSYKDFSERGDTFKRLVVAL